MLHPDVTFPAWIAAGHPGPVLVGYSGGLDSTVLLQILAACPEARRRGLRALHVHHGLHPDADAWAARCGQVCASLSVPFELARVRVERGAGDGLEAAARRARHAAFAAALSDDEILALAHHRDDQAETVLLRALRASGPDGLAAMRPWRRYRPGWLWRPLLATPREALRARALAAGWSWLEDPSNHYQTLDRNFLRWQVMPLLRDRWPAVDDALCRVATLQDEASALLRDEDARALAGCRTPDPQALAVPALLALPRARRARLLRDWIAALGLPPLPAGGVARIETDLLPAAADADARYAWSGARVARWRKLLHAAHERAPLPSGWSTAWDGAPLTLPTGDRLSFENAGTFPAQGLRVHARTGGERIVMPGRRHSHALKHVLQSLGVPPWERERLPLVSAADGTVLAAGDLVYSAGFHAWLRQHHARLRWQRL